MHVKIYLSQVTGPSIEEIKQKIVQVIEVLNHTKTQRDELLKENARLSETNEHLKKANHSLELANTELQFKLKEMQSLPVSEKQHDNKNTEIKSKIRELAAEIDKCIAMLNQEK